MIEKVLYDYLSDELNTDVYMTRPEEEPDTYVVIEKTGSTKQNHLSTATFAIQSYAPTLFDAASLNETVKEAVEASIRLDTITKAELNTDYNFTDPSRKQPRYQAVFVITHY